MGGKSHFVSTSSPKSVVRMLITKWIFLIAYSRVFIPSQYLHVPNFAQYFRHFFGQNALMFNVVVIAARADLIQIRSFGEYLTIFGQKVILISSKLSKDSVRLFSFVSVDCIMLGLCNLDLRLFLAGQWRSSLDRDVAWQCLSLTWWIPVVWGLTSPLTPSCKQSTWWQPTVWQLRLFLHD